MISLFVFLFYAESKNFLANSGFNMLVTCFVIEQYLWLYRLISCASIEFLHHIIRQSMKFPTFLFEDILS